MPCLQHSVRLWFVDAVRRRSAWFGSWSGGGRVRAVTTWSQADEAVGESAQSVTSISPRRSMPLDSMAIDVPPSGSQGEAVESALPVLPLPESSVLANSNHHSDGHVSEVD